MAKTTQQETPSPDSVADQIRQFGSELMAAADNVELRTAKLKEVERFLGSLQVKDFPELAESPVVQQFVQLLGGTAPLRPGETRNRGTLAEVTKDWTWRDLDQFERKTFTPNESLPLTWNGLTIYVSADVEVTLPEPFYNLYREHREAIRQAQIHERWLLGRSNQMPNPNYLTAEGAKVRAWSQQGQGHLGVGPIAMGEGGEAAEGEQSG